MNQPYLVGQTLSNSRQPDDNQCIEETCVCNHYQWLVGITGSHSSHVLCPGDTLSVVRESRESIEIDWFLISHEADGAANRWLDMNIMNLGVL